MRSFGKPFLLLLAFSTLFGLSSCQCSRGQKDAPTEQQAPAPETLAEQSFDLQNGLHVELVSGNCGESAALVVLLKTGIDHDPPTRSGMAHLVERLLTTSGKDRSVQAGTDYTLYSVVAAGDRLGEEIDAIAAWMSKSPPSEADFTRERMNVLQDIGKLQGDDAARTALTMAEESLQPTRGEGKRRGIVANVEAITYAELLSYWESHIKPSNARIVVMGRFDAAAIRTRLESAFGAIAAGTPPTLRDPSASSVRGTLVMGNAPTAVAIAVPAPAMTDANYASFLVLASRLLEKPAQPRTWEAKYDPLLRPEILYITGPVGPTEQPEPSAARMRKEVQTLLDRPFDPADLAKTRETFQAFFEHHSVDPAFCARDARSLAIARARGAQLQLDVAPIAKALVGTTKETLTEAAKAFDSQHSAGVIAGGSMR